MHADFGEKYDDVDLSHFNKRRARMLRDLGRAISKKESTNSQDDYKYFLPRTTIGIDIEREFDTSMCRMTELAKTVNPPNKVSLIAEFERIRHIVGHAPTEQDIEKHSMLHLAQYEEEFGSWEYLLDKMGYDPRYKHEYDRRLSETDPNNVSQEDYKADTKSETPARTLDDMREAITNRLKDEPDMLQLFANVEQNISKLSADEIKLLLSSIDHY